MNVSAKLDLLFRTVRRDDDKEYSYRDIERLTGGEITATTVWKIRTNQTTNPSQKTILALSRAFHVPISYFFDKDLSVEDIPRYRDAYRSNQMVEQIALRASELDDEGKQAILDMIKIVKNSHVAS